MLAQESPLNSRYLDCLNRDPAEKNEKKIDCVFAMINGSLFFQKEMTTSFALLQQLKTHGDMP